MIKIKNTFPAIKYSFISRNKTIGPTFLTAVLYGCIHLFSN